MPTKKSGVSISQKATGRFKNGLRLNLLVPHVQISKEMKDYDVVQGYVGVKGAG